jgi:PAS domain-containing protein
VANLADLAAWAASEIELRAGRVRDRRRAEAVQRTGEARQRANCDGTYEYIGLVSPDGRVLDCNRASLEFVGNTRDDVIGRFLRDTPWFVHTRGAPERLKEHRACGRRRVRPLHHDAAPADRPADHVRLLTAPGPGRRRRSPGSQQASLRTASLGTLTARGAAKSADQSPHGVDRRVDGS